MKTILMFIALALTMANDPFAAETKKDTSKEPSKEARQKMAKIHENMASCLKSNKPMSECRGEMKNHCQQMMGESGCSMMRQMMDRKDMMGNGVMNGGDEKK